MVIILLFLMTNCTGKVKGVGIKSESNKVYYECNKVLGTIEKLEDILWL